MDENKAYTIDCLTKRGALPLGPVVPGERVIWVQKAKYYSHYIPGLAAVVGPCAGDRVKILLWTHGEETRVVARASLFVEPDSDWHAGRPLYSVMHHDRFCVGQVLLPESRTEWTYQYPDGVEVEDEQVERDWIEHPEMFRRR